MLILIWIIFQWPFVRFLGIQEPASVLFSIFNAVGHILGWRRLRSCVPSTDYDMHLVWKINFVVRPLERRHWFSFVVHENLIQLATKMVFQYNLFQVYFLVQEFVLHFCMFLTLWYDKYGYPAAVLKNLACIYSMSTVFNGTETERNTTSSLLQHSCSNVCGMLW